MNKIPESITRKIAEYLAVREYINLSVCDKFFHMNIYNSEKIEEMIENCPRSKIARVFATSDLIEYDLTQYSECDRKTIPFILEEFVARKLLDSLNRYIDVLGSYDECDREQMLAYRSFWRLIRETRDDIIKLAIYCEYTLDDLDRLKCILRIS